MSPARRAPALVLALCTLALRTPKRVAHSEGGAGRNAAFIARAGPRSALDKKIHGVPTWPCTFRRRSDFHILRQVGTPAAALDSPSRAIAAPSTTSDDKLPIELLNGYDTTLSKACQELESCGPGDEVLFSVFVFEPGESSEMLIAALTSAATRGVKIILRTDISAFSWFTRFCEGTTTLIGRLQELSESMPDCVFFEPPEFPTHVKLLVFRRSDRNDVAIFGGINVGDRFASWRDFSVRVSGQRGVSTILAALGWSYFEGRPLQATGLERLRFVTNRPKAWDWVAWLARSPFAGDFDLVSAMERFFGEKHLLTYRVAASYIDDSGLELLSLALSRGARVEIVLPRVPNVYKDCNARTVGLLLEQHGGTGLLTVRLHGDMVHAKAAVAEGVGGPAARVGYIGSCNLKRRSFIQFEELNAFTEDQPFCDALWRELGVLVDEAEVVTSPRELPFSPVTAGLEDYFG